ncbi:MAG: translocation/assembly module TamB [Spirochaetaceae bacterium]|jgi:hypothetical protein|nr:translocation/assembly module TamB [Spirochaetaceae bacterium]
MALVKMARKSSFNMTIFLFIGLVLLTSALLKPLQKQLLDNVELLRDAWIEKLEILSGKTITYASMRPSILGTIDIKDIRFHGGENDPLPNISVKRLRVKYSLALFFADNLPKIPVLPTLTISVEDPFIEINTEKDINELFSGNGGGEGNVFDTIKNIVKIAPENLILRVSGGNVRFRAAQSTIQAEKAAFFAQMKNNTLRFKFSANTEARLTVPPDIEAIEAAFSVRVDGVYNAQNEESGIKVSLASVKTSYFIMDKLELLASFTKNNIRLQKTGYNEPYELLINYDLTNGSLEARAKFASFRASRILRFPAKFESWNKWLGTRLSGELRASFSKVESFSYAAALSGDIDNRSPIGGGRFELDVKGGAESAYFNNFYVSLPRGDLSWTGRLNFKPLMPNGALVINDFNLTKSGLKDKSSSMNGSFIVSSYGSTISFFADTFSIKAPESPGAAVSGNVELQAFDITIEHNGGDIELSASAFRVKNTESYDEASFAPVSVDASFNFDSKNMEIRLEPESFSVYDIIKIAGCAVELPDFPAQARDFFDNIIITSEIFVSTDFKNLLYNVPHLIVVWQGGSNIWASLSLSGTENNFELSESHIVWNGAGLDVSARGDFEDINDITLASELRTKDNSYTLQASLLDKSALYVSSSFGLSLNVNVSQNSAFTGLLFLNTTRIPMGGGFADLSTEADFRYDSPASWVFNLVNFKISGIKSALSSNTTVELTGYVDQDGAEFDRIYFDDGRGALYGSAFGTWDGFFRHEEAVVTGNIGLQDASGSETLNAQLRYADDSLFVWAELNDLQSGRFFNSTDNMFITGGLGLFKTPENWSAAFDLTSLSGVLFNQPITLTGRGSLDNTGLVLGETRFSYAGFFADISFLNIDLRQSSMSSMIHLYGETLNREFNTDINFNASFAEIDSWLNIGAALKSFDGVMEFENTRFDTLENVENFDLKFSRVGQILNIEGGPENMIRLHMNGGGDFFAAFSYPSPALGTISGFIKDGRIDAEISNLYLDVSSLWSYIPSDRIKVSGGFIIADFRVHGPLRDPEFFGTAVANSLRLSIPSILADEIGPTPVFLTLSGNEIRLEPVGVRIGKGRGTLSGNLHISRWIPSSFNAYLSVEQAEDIPLNMNVAGFLLKGSVFGVINLNGDGQTLNVLGDIGSDNIEISLEVNENSPSDGDERRSLLPLQTDIKITAGRKVEFLWPNADIPILQAYATAGSSIRVVSDSLSRHFSINGDVGIRGGEVFYFQRSFYIKEGSINFNESEVQFDPRFSVVAETRDRTNNEPVTISMIVENQPLRSFTPRLDANPPLSQIEILTLLGDKLSGTPDEDNAIRRAFVSSTADVIAQFGVVRQFERTVRDFLHIDMFSLRTQAIQNAILLNVFRDNNNDDVIENEDTAQTQMRTQPNQVRIGNYFDNTTVFLGKYIGAGLFLQVMFSLRYDPLSTNMGGLVIEPDLSMEFKGPIFDIRWDLMPAYPENIWTNDNWISGNWIIGNKITLSKKWTLP